MRHSRATQLFALVGTAAVVVSLAPAGAQTVIAPRFKTERTYVHCGQTPKVQTIDSLQGRIPTWNTTAPTTSFQAGAGCGTFDPPVSTFGTPASALDDTSDMVWQGTFTGNIDSIVVHAHAIWMGPGKIKEQAQNAASAGLAFTLIVDGEAVALPAAVSPKIYKSSTGISSEFVFTVDGLGYIDPVTDANQDGIADDEGTTTRTIKLKLNPQGSDNPFMVWVWDATEVKSGLDFNGTLDGPVVSPAE